MNQKNAADFSQELLDLFDQYVHGIIDRRAFVSEATKFAVGGMTATALLDALSPKFAEAQQVPKDDKRLHTEYIEYSSPRGSGKVRGYLARPAQTAGKLPAVLVVHENRGLNPHIEDVARRLARFVAQACTGSSPETADSNIDRRGRGRAPARLFAEIRLADLRRSEQLRAGASHDHLAGL